MENKYKRANTYGTPPPLPAIMAFCPQLPRWIMFDPNLFNDLAKKMTEALPQNFQAMKQDMEKQFKLVLQNTFNKLDLITREEFDVQSQVLARTRQQVEALEQQVSMLEEKQGVSRSDHLPPENTASADKQ